MGGKELRGTRNVCDRGIVRGRDEACLVSTDMAGHIDAVGRMPAITDEK